MNRALLINSPSRLYGSDCKHEGERSLTPYGLASVATYAARELDTEGGLGLIDADYFGLSVDVLLDGIKDFIEEDGVVGINVLTPNFVPTMVLAKRISDALPKIRLVFGGPHATLDPESILKFVPNSAVVVGDGEMAFAELVKGTPASEIPGLAIVDPLKGGKLVKTGPIGVNVVRELDKLPWLNRNYVANEPFEKAGRNTMTFVTARGCAGNCAFCITPAQWNVLKEGGAKKVRYRDLYDVVSEVCSLRDQRGINHAQFIDDEMLPSPARAQEFISLWNEKGLAGKMTFGCLLRSDRIRKFGEMGILRELKAAGLNRLSIGIETGYDRGRRLVSGRGGKIDPKYEQNNIMGALEACSQVGIRTKGFIMLGLPGESAEEMEETLAYMYSLKSYGLEEVAIFPVKVYPGTRLWDVAVGMGFSPEELGHYEAPNVSKLINEGLDPISASRDGYVQTAQISEFPPEELNRICQHHMAQFNQ